MKGLSSDIEEAIEIILQGIDYEVDLQDVDDDKVERAMKAKLESFKFAKTMLNKWVNSPNAPSLDKVTLYVKRLLRLGDKSITALREALKAKIFYEDLDPHKHAQAIKAKPIILSAIFELDADMAELKVQLDGGKLNLEDKEFRSGYAERFAKQEFYPIKKYHKEWYDKKREAIVLDPKGSKGEMVTLDGLNIILPQVPKNNAFILFSTEPKAKQYWRRREIPRGLTPENVDAYSKYILEEFRRRREGVWFMNNGEPVYLTGHHYFALQWCKMRDTGGYMDFRYGQLNIFYHQQACKIDKRCLGQIFCKGRRTGFTYITLARELEEGTSTCNGNFGLTSKTEVDAKEAFIKLSYMFLNLPFFFQPIVKGVLESEKSVTFGKPASLSKEYKKRKQTNTDDYLNTTMDYRASKDGAYDSMKLDFYMGDEAGKRFRDHDIIEHLNVIKPTMMPGGRIVGKAYLGSTVGFMDKGGSQFKDLYYASNPRERDDVTGRTKTALYHYFLPAHKNQEAFTDIYGICHEETPPPGTKNIFGDPIEIGTIAFLKAEYEAAKKRSDLVLNAKYRAEPMTLSHAFRDDASECAFNITKIYDQIDHNETIGEANLCVQGNFEWEDGVKDTNVIWHPNELGRFRVSWMPSSSDDTLLLRNNVKRLGDLFYPQNDDLGGFGCDPFSIGATASGGFGSKGGLHGLTRSGLIDIPSNQFFLEYIHKTKEAEVFFEDVIKACYFYSMPILVESNRIDLLRYMKNRGYRHFCVNRIDKPAHQLTEADKVYGGMPLMLKTADMHQNALSSWIENYVGKSNKEDVRPVGEIGHMPFMRTLEDWLKYDPTKRTKFDATISSGLAIMLCQKDKYKFKERKPDFDKVTPFFKKFRHSNDIGEIIKRAG